MSVDDIKTKLEYCEKLYWTGHNMDKEFNSIRLNIEDHIDKYESTVNDLIGKHYSENDIIIEARINNYLVELNALYARIIDLINTI